MKKLLLLVVSFFVVNAAYAQCNSEAGNPVPPAVADPYCFENASDLAVTSYTTEPDASLVSGFIVASLEDGQTAGEGAIVGVSFDGTWDFNGTNPITGEAYANGSYAFIPSVYSATDLQALITNPIVTAVIPFTGDEMLDEVINAIITNQTVLDLIGVEVVTTDEFYNTLLPTLVALVGTTVCVNSNTDNAYVVNVECLDGGSSSIADMTAETINIYPNPANNVAFITFDSKTNFNATVEMYNLTGKLVSNQMVNVNAGSNKIEVNTSNLSAGVYLIQLNDGVNAITQRLTVNR